MHLNLNSYNILHCYSHMAYHLHNYPYTTLVKVFQIDHIKQFGENDAILVLKNYSLSHGNSAELQLPLHNCYLVFESWIDGEADLNPKHFR